MESIKMLNYITFVFDCITEKNILFTFVRKGSKRFPAQWLGDLYHIAEAGAGVTEKRTKQNPQLNSRQPKITEGHSLSNKKQLYVKDIQYIHRNC